MEGGGAMNRRIFLAAGLLALRLAGAAEVGWVETWSGDTPEGWVCHDLVNEKPGPGLTLDAGALAMGFAAQSMRMPPEQYMFKAGADASGGRCVGDYVANGVTALRFRLRVDLPVQVEAAIYSQDSNRWWRHPVAGIITGGWQDVTVPVDPAVLREVNGVADLASFEADLRRVTWVGIVITRNDSTAAQVCRLDDVVLLGAGPEFADWMAQQGLGEGGNVLPGADADGDGLSNFGEWVAGTSPLDGADDFSVSMDRPGAAPGVTIRWRSAPDRIYSVWRGRGMDAGFEAVADGLSATPPTNVFVDASAVEPGPYYYKVKVTR